MTDTRLSSWPYPAIIAHRGAGKLAPENTLAAFRLGHQLGQRAFEFDVKLSSDGHSFLLHDDTLARTTNGQGRADALTLGELARLDAGSWHSATFAGESLPTLAAIARYLLANDALANIEIKPVPGRERQTGAAVALDAANLWQQAAVPPLLSSFSLAALQAAAEAAPALPLALLLDEWADDWQAQLAACGAMALDCNHLLLDEKRIRAIKHAGYRLLCYTANEPSRVAQLLAWGVDSVITDAVEQIRP